MQLFVALSKFRIDLPKAKIDEIKLARLFINHYVWGSDVSVNQTLGKDSYEDNQRKS